MISNLGATGLLRELNKQGRSGESALADWLSNQLMEEGYAEAVKNPRRVNLNIMYTSEASEFVFVYVYNKNKDTGNPILMDKAVLEGLGTRNIFYVLTHNDTDMCPCVRLDGKNKKLHIHVGEGGADTGLCVDHITLSTRVATKESLRKVTSKQNRRHTFEYVKVDKKTGRSFSATLTLTADEVEEFRALGYAVYVTEGTNDARIVSRAFNDEDEMYREINRIESRFLGAYRYNPLVACDTMLSLYLFMVWKLFDISDEVYYEAKKILFIQEKGVAAAKMYGLIS